MNNFLSAEIAREMTKSSRATLELKYIATLKKEIIQATKEGRYFINVALNSNIVNVDNVTNYLKLYGYDCYLTEEKIKGYYSITISWEA